MGNPIAIVFSRFLRKILEYPNTLYYNDVESEVITMSTIAERLNEIMNRYEIGNRELSRKTGINAGDISHYRKGDYEPKRNNIYLISKALNVSPAWLMGLDLPENQVLLDNEILDMWHQLSPNQQMDVLHHIKSLAEDHIEEA